MNQVDFAKIVRATDGRQVLYYVNPQDGDYILHQVVMFDDYSADVKIGFTSSDEEKNRRSAYAALEIISQQPADNIIKIVQDMMEGK